MALRVRATRDLDENLDAVAAINHYFGQDLEPERGERFAKLLPFERMHAAFDDGAIVGGAGSFPFDLTVPGGPLACAGVTMVGVLPTHRRRGVLRRMMAAQLADVRERGEPIAALWASEETIYGRYGYGLASLDAMMRASRVHAEIRPDLPRAGNVRVVGAEEAARVFPRVYERVARRSVGFLSRSRDWWELRTLNDDPTRRRGRSALARALLEIDGRPAGYALYRLSADFDDAINRGKVDVQEAIGIDDVATREVWRYLLGIDWIEEVHCQLLPVDHPLLLLVQRPNRLSWRVFDGLWVRLVDVAAALAARTYGGDGRATIEVVSDPQFPDNVGRFTLQDGTVKRSRGRVDVRLDVQALGASYLGGFTFTQLARAGRVEEVSRGGLARADALFRTDRAPWTPEIF